jgi:hypothetical protein
MELSSNRLESSSRIQQRDSDAAGDLWPQQRRRRQKAGAPAEHAQGNGQTVMERCEDEDDPHRFDDTA